MADKTYTHLYKCLTCGASVEVEHPDDDFVYADECPECGSDKLEGLDIAEWVR